MKKLFLIAAAALMVATCQGQTNSAPPASAPPAGASIFGGVGQILTAVGLVTDPTNYAAVTFYGRSLKGNQSAAGLLVIENVNNYLGIAGGVDTLWGGGKIGSANIVAGGLSLKNPTHPLQFLGTNSFFTQFTLTPFAIALAGTPMNGTSNDGGLAAIARTGVNFDIVNFKGWQLGAGIDYGNRSGAGNYSGNWVDFSLSVRKGF